MTMMWGELFSLAAAATWAVGVILYRQLGLSLSPLSLNFLKNLLVLAGLLPIALLVDSQAFAALPARDIVLALVSGAIGIAVADTLYFRALNALGAARMGILGNSYSPWVIVLSVIALGERLSVAQWAGFALVSSGVLLVVWPARSRRNLPSPATADTFPELVVGDRAQEPTAPTQASGGALIGVLSIFLMAFSIVMIKPTLEAQPLLPVTIVRMFGALLGMTLVVGLRGNWGALWPRRGTVPWLRLAIAALFGQGLSMVFWLAGYKLTDAAVAAILNETASVFILLLAWFWLGERPGRKGLAGVALAFSGVACMLLLP
jgi:drug/metabolite transporter (DMT)-like permease